MGGGGNDTITGDATIPGIFDLTQGGSDSATGGAGNDGFKLGGSFDATDHINGGGGTNNLRTARRDLRRSGTISLNDSELLGISR